MIAAPEPISIGLLAYPGAQAAALYGLQDLLTTANRMGAAQAGARRTLEPRIVDGATALSTAPPFTVLVLPPCLGYDTACAPDPALVAWLRAQHGAGTLLCSVCAGAFLLAETGLLNGRPATTHWALADAFRARFPGVDLDPDRLLVDDGDLVTAGGLMAWVDLGLALIHRFLGTEAMLETARLFLVDPGGREQRFYAPFAPRLDHGDRAILAIQHGLQTLGAETVSVADLAHRAAMSERTFLRRFHKATGFKPAAYLQHLRIGRARFLLERGDLTQEAIAWEVGYADVGAFRARFQALMGLSPGEYRRRFQVGIRSGNGE